MVVNMDRQRFPQRLFYCPGTRTLTDMVQVCTMDLFHERSRMDNLGRYIIAGQYPSLAVDAVRSEVVNDGRHDPSLPTLSTASAPANSEGSSAAGMCSLEIHCAYN